MNDIPEIPNWRRIDNRITTSGQPSEAQLAMLAAAGVTCVFNLGLPDHPQALPDEARAVAALDMAYVHIPVAFDAPTEDDYRGFCEAMRRRQHEKIHVHCIVNARVSAFFFRYRRDVLRSDPAQARAAMETVWRPGGIWAAFIGAEAAVALPHRYAGIGY